MEAFLVLERRFVENVERLRRFKHLSAEEVSMGAGLPRLAVAHMEYRSRHLRLGEALALCAFLGVELNEMVSEKPLTVRIPIE